MKRVIIIICFTFTVCLIALVVAGALVAGAIWTIIAIFYALWLIFEDKKYYKNKK